jgi:hypothetical protein
MDEELTVKEEEEPMVKEEADTSDIEIKPNSIKQEVPFPFAFVAIKTEVQVHFFT